jgi:hypothetical protein
MPTRIVLILSLLAALAIIATVGVRAHLRQGALEEQALAEAKFQNAALEAIEGEARELLAQAADAVTITRATPDGCGAALTALSRTYAFSSALAAFDRTGALLCSGAARWLTHLDPRLLALGLATTDFVVGELTTAEAINRKVLPFAQPFFDQDHRIAGIVVTVIELDKLARRLARNWRFDNSIITVADRSATILVHLPQSGSWVGRRLPEGLVSVLDRPAAGTTLLAEGFADHIQAVGYVPVTIAPKDLFLSVGFPTTTPFGEIKGWLRRSVGPVTIVLIAAGLLLAVLPRSGRE